MTQRAVAVCVLGMHRSGTSVAAHALHSLGISMGDENELMPADANNLSGYWENLRFVQFNERILNSLSVTWDSLKPISSNVLGTDFDNKFYDEVGKFVSLEFANQPLWAWKDPRTCVTFPVWQRVLDDLNVEVRCLIMFRNPLDVASSLYKRDGIPLQRGLLLWTLYTLSALRSSMRKHRSVISYESMLKEPTESAKKFVKELSLGGYLEQFAIEKYVEDVIQAGLQHNTSSLDDVIHCLAVAGVTEQTYRLCLKAESDKLYQDSQSFCEEVEKLWAGYKKLISGQFAALSTPRLQVFSFAEEERHDMSTDSFVVQPTDDFTTAKVQISLLDANSIRIDPLNLPGLMEFRSIRLLQNNLETGALENLCVSDSSNRFHGLSVESGCYILDESDTFVVLSTNNDPQLRLEIDSIDTSIKAPIQVVVEFEYRVHFEITEYLGENFEKLTEHVQIKQQEVHHLQSVIEGLKEELVTYGELKEELLLYKQEVQVTESQMKELSVRLEVSLEKQKELEENLVRKQLMIHGMMNSTSWRLTEPLRRLRHIFNR